MGTSTSGRPARSRAGANGVPRRRPRAPREGITSAGGFELYVRERGDGQPLLLINGLGANLEMWDRASAALAARSRVVMFDAPGMGRSSPPLLPQTIGSLTRTVIDLLDELGHGRVDVLGYSLGGAIAQQLARDAPERVRRVALVSTSCGWGGVPGQLPSLTLVTTPFAWYSRLVFEPGMRMLEAAEGTAAYGYLPLDAALRYPPSAVGYLYLLWAGMAWSSLPWLSGVQAPTLVVTGAGDSLTPSANGVQLAGLLPLSRLHLLPGRGHRLVFGDAEAHGLLADFFASPEFESCAAWTSGAVVDREDARAAVRPCTGFPPVKLLSDAFRWLVERADAAP